MVIRDENFDWRSRCPISSALDVLGDKWSLIIIRDLIIYGPRTYSQLLESPERISTNILASRLDSLMCLRLIERENANASSRNNAYKLTEAGAALRPVIEGLGKWADTHLSEFHATIIKMQ